MSRSPPARARLPPGQSGSPLHSLPGSGRLRTVKQSVSGQIMASGSEAAPRPALSPRPGPPTPASSIGNVEGQRSASLPPQHAGSPDGLVALRSDRAAFSSPESFGLCQIRLECLKRASPGPGSRPSGFRGSQLWTGGPAFSVGPQCPGMTGLALGTTGRLPGPHVL